MNIKKILFFVTLIFLFSIFSSYGWAFEYGGQTCSSDPLDYQYYNDSVSNILVDGATIISIDPIDQTTNQVFALHVINFKWTNNVESGGQINTRDSSNYISQLVSDQPDPDTSWAYYTSSWNDIPFDSSEGEYYNITEIFNFSSDSINYTIRKTDSEYSTDWVLDRNSVNFENIYLYASGGGNTDGIYVWNCTEPTCSCPTELQTGTTINLSSPYPLSDSQFNTQSLNFNVSVNASNQFNCSLYINDTFNVSSDNHSSGSDIIVDFNVSFGATEESNFNYTIGCYDYMNDTNTSTITNIYIDNVDTTMTWNYPLTDNSTAYNIHNDSTFNVSVLLSDSNLYSYYYNLSYKNGALINTTNKTDLTGLSTFTITNSTSLSSITGVLTATIEACDGHTDNIIDFTASKYDNELLFDGVKVYQNNKLDTSLINYKKQIDRYNFLFTTTTSTSYKEFVVESDEYIDILDGKTKYKGHLVTGNKWIDFEMVGIKKVKVTRVNDYKVIVRVETYNPTNKWNFDSIGELNCIVEEKEFFSYDVNQSYTQEVIVTQSNDFTLTLDYNSSFITSLSADLLYNGTYYSASGSQVGNTYVFTKTLNAPEFSQEENVTFKWNYSVNSDTFDFEETNQTIFRPYIDNCSSYSTRWINFSIIDEITGDPVIALIEFDFDYQINNYTATYTGTTTNSSSNYEFCMYPPSAQFITNATINYRLTSGSTISRSYIGSNLNVNNSSVQQIDLEILENPTEITFHVINTEDKDLENILVRAYRYDVATDSDVLVQSEYTDSSGNLIFGLRTGTTQYSFKFYQEGSLVLSTNRFKLFATSYEYVLGEGVSSRLGEWVVLSNGITNTLTYSNSTDKVLFTFSTSLDLVDQFCLEVNLINGTSYYDTCTTNKTGSLDYTITTFNLTYVAIGKVITTTGSEFNIITLNIDTRDNWRKLGVDNSLFIGFIVFLIISCFGLINPNIAIVFSIVALIFLSLFNIIPLGIGWITTIIVVGIVILVVINRRQI